MALTASFYYLLLDKDLKIVNVSSHQMGDHSFTTWDNIFKNDGAFLKTVD